MDKKSAFKPLKDNEIALFCEQMALILKTGISSKEGLSLMLEDTGSGEGKDLLEFMYGMMDEGRTFTEAITASDVWPRYVTDMTSLGEASGNLDDVMESLGIYYRREAETARSVKSAVTYPLVMIAMLLAVIILLVIKVLPIFNDVYRQLGAEMSGVSRGLLNFGYALGKGAMVLVIVLIAIAAAIAILRRTASGKAFLSHLGDHFIFTKNTRERRALGRFASGMSMTIHSGLDTDEGFALVSRLVDNEPLRKKIAVCQEHMAGGENMGNAIVSAGIFSGLYGRMINIGFRTGSLDLTMKRISDSVDEEIEEGISHTLSILEPTLVAVLSILVGMILLSVMLPLMGIMMNIG